jgi:hypothetical protein
MHSGKPYRPGGSIDPALLIAYAYRPGARGGRGVALEAPKKGGAHYPNLKILLKTSIRPYDNSNSLKKIFLRNVLLLECGYQEV